MPPFSSGTFQVRPPVSSLDLTDGGETCLDGSIGVGRSALECEVELDWPCGAPDGEVTRQLPLPPGRGQIGRPEGDEGVARRRGSRRNVGAYRSRVPVVIDAALASISTVDCVGSSATTMVASRSSNVPRTLVTIKCRAVIVRSLWTGSMRQVPPGGTDLPSTVRTADMTCLLS